METKLIISYERLFYIKYFFFFLELGNITFPELPQETILEVNFMVLSNVYRYIIISCCFSM